MKVILEIGQSANQFLTKHEPWKKKKTDLEGARAVLSDAAEIAYLVAALLEPVVPTAGGDAVHPAQRAAACRTRRSQKAKYPLLDRARPIGDPYAAHQPHGGGTGGHADSARR